MNFSKKGTINKQKHIRSTPHKLMKKANVTFFRAFLVCIIIIVVVGSISMFGLIKGLIDNAPSIDSIEVAPTGFITTIYDQDGEEVQNLVGADANRIYVTIDKIPDMVENAFIAIEDERFREHNGIDVKGIFRAFFTGMANGEFDQGASTLTQQLLKNQVFEGGNETSTFAKFERKIQEQYLAIQLETKHSKDEILEYYLNYINLGQNTLGVQAASKRYFNKDVQDLTLSEATVIAGITQNPSNLNPLTYPDNNAQRRKNVLDKMLELKFVSQEEYDEALLDDVYTRIQNVNTEEYGGSNYNSYFVDELIEQAVDDLQEELGYSSTQATNLLYTGGLKIYTTQDKSLQNIADKVLADESYYPDDSEWELQYRLSVMHEDGKEEHFSEINLKNYFNSKENNTVSQQFNLYFDNKEDADKYIKEYRESVLKSTDEITGETTSFKLQPQISFVLMDQSTGQIKAIVGGRGQKEGNRTLNRATNTKRQPGSTFKILSTYLPALDSAGMTLATVQDDAEYTYPGTTKKVSNWGGNYKGLSTLRQGITNSMNIVTVKTLNEVTPQIGYDYLQQLGFTTIVDKFVDDEGAIHSDINLPMALGGLTDGVTNLELTAAYATVANGGVYTEPTFYTKIVDHNGKVLLEAKPKTTQVMKDSTAWLLTDAMEDVVNYGTGKLIRFSNVNMPVAGKTGTTSNDLDLWFSGYTPYYTATIWGGYDNNENQSNTTYHKKIWKAIMEEIHKDLKKKSFIKPDSIVSANICTKSGKLAVEGVCENALGGSTVRKEYFAKGTVPTEKCDVHIKYSVCSASGELATEFCPLDLVEDIVYLIKEETSKTPDSKLLLPKGLEKSSCHIHTSMITPPPALPVIPSITPVPTTIPVVPVQ